MKKTLEYIDKDILTLLALDLGMPDILNLCLTNKRFNNLICDNNNFWRKKIEKERPNLLKIFSNNYRQIYNEIYKNKSNRDFTLTDDGYLIKGDFTNLINGDLIFHVFADIKIGEEVWIGSSNISEIYPTILYIDKKDGIKDILREISFRFEDDDDLIIDFDIDEKIIEIEKNFEKYDDYTFEFEDFSFSLNKKFVF